MYSEVKINRKKLRHLTPDSITDGKGTKPGDSALVVVGGGRGRMVAGQPRAGDEEDDKQDDGRHVAGRRTSTGQGEGRQNRMILFRPLFLPRVSSQPLFSSAIFSPQTPSLRGVLRSPQTNHSFFRSSLMPGQRSAPGR